MLYLSSESRHKLFALLYFPARVPENEILDHQSSPAPAARSKIPMADGSMRRALTRSMEYHVPTLIVGNSALQESLLFTAERAAPAAFLLI